MRKHLFSFWPTGGGGRDKWWPWICVIMILFLMMGCAILGDLIGQPQLQTYTFNYDGHEYSALLPKEVALPPEFPEMEFFCYSWIGPLCAVHIRYVERYPVMSLWFTQEKGVLALVYHAEVDGEVKHTPYIYLKGLPIKVSGEEIQAKLNEWVTGPKQ